MPSLTNSAAVGRALLGSPANLPWAAGSKCYSAGKRGMRDLRFAVALSHRFCSVSWSSGRDSSFLAAGAKPRYLSEEHSGLWCLCGHWKEVGALGTAQISATCSTFWCCWPLSAHCEEAPPGTASSARGDERGMRSTQC